MWNIYDLQAFNTRTPKFTRLWLAKKKKQRREDRKKQVGFRVDVKGGAISDEGSLSPSRSPVRKGAAGAISDCGSDQGDDSSSEGDGKGGITIKNAQ
jgi:hypothetical protein